MNKNWLTQDVAEVLERNLTSTRDSYDITRHEYTVVYSKDANSIIVVVNDTTSEEKTVYTVSVNPL